MSDTFFYSHPTHGRIVEKRAPQGAFETIGKMMPGTFFLAWHLFLGLLDLKCFFIIA
jgi:hypothetical protein